ncbi:hypothetical protein [Nesterenkonia flava]|uniref:Uncharacterized protein n=1 Tax=Nesterenkonia flava TaxID=469799 RepID=A0ABU1FQJ8_9MICC|nr:hypothetical protein [Nesterenkonia flava]MDR5710910.1 hypothetical protein [Nesterenkonia flava]
MSAEQQRPPAPQHPPRRDFLGSLAANRRGAWGEVYLLFALAGIVVSIIMGYRLVDNFREAMGGPHGAPSVGEVVLSGGLISLVLVPAALLVAGLIHLLTWAVGGPYPGRRLPPGSPPHPSSGPRGPGY